ncbi:IS630 family transposase [Flavobacterium sp. CS20]|uniref:IS630 family transposase n=1 Tax=Flavobacterium sp. CS20 TaxID=2775246 RepID=UPI001B39FE6D|nr:IS630 family transposase [Flavobacterium sp. CS20]QTY27740.1 IS630 family transposase [Flavobacterium sp. CS20]
MEKTDFRKLTSSERYQFRKRAVTLVKSGKKQKEIASLFGVRPATVSSWMKSYKLDGNKALKENTRGVKSEDKKLLSTAQEKEIQKMIIDVMPDQLKLDYALWTRKAVKELVEREFGVVLAVNTMGDYLRSWGFTPQKPKKRAYEQCHKKVQKWLDEEYPAIKERAKKESAEIQWGDETGVRNSNQHGRSYAPKGKTPVKKHKAQRFSVNMFSTVTNQGQVRFMLYTGSMNADRCIEFMSKLIENKEQKVYLILDNLRVYHSKIVKQWAEENKEKIELFYLPSYSPEKNPDEYLNCDLKYGLSEKPAPKNQKQLQDNIENHMNMLSQNSERVKKYFHHHDIKYLA